MDHSRATSEGIVSSGSKSSFLMMVLSGTSRKKSSERAELHMTCNFGSWMKFGDSIGRGIGSVEWAGKGGRLN